MRFRYALWIAAGVAASAAFAGCGGGGSSNNNVPGGGQQPVTTTGLQVKLKDGPGNFEHVWVTISSVTTVGSNGNVVDVNSTPQTVDLLHIPNVDMVIGTASLPAGQYSQIRLKISAASVVDNTGTTFNLKVPSGAQTGIKLVDNFTITNDQITSVLLDFNAAQSIVRTGNSHAKNGVQYLLKPVIQVVTQIISGQISGIVLDSATSQPIAAIDNPLVTAYPAGSPTDGSVPASATAVVSATDGSYLLIRLPAGSYDLYFSADGYITKVADSVAVAANATTNEGTVRLSTGP